MLSPDLIALAVMAVCLLKLDFFFQCLLFAFQRKNCF